MALTAYVQAGFLRHKEQSAFVYGTSINQLMQKKGPTTTKRKPGMFYYNPEVFGIGKIISFKKLKPLILHSSSHVHPRPL